MPRATIGYFLRQKTNITGNRMIKLLFHADVHMSAMVGHGKDDPFPRMK